MARKKIREYDSKRLLKEHIKRLAGLDLPLKAAQVSITCTVQPHHPQQLTITASETQSADMCAMMMPPRTAVSRHAV
jgi:hypothetical protein